MARRTDKKIAAQVVEEYVGGQGVMEISAARGLHRSTVQRILLDAGVELRKRTPAAKHDVGFFRSYTAPSCYWAGFIMADGCVRSDRAAVNIHLAKKDRGHLERFARVVGFTGEIEDTDKSCRLTVCGPWYVADLASTFGVRSRKTRDAA